MKLLIYCQGLQCGRWRGPSRWPGITGRRASLLPINPQTDIGVECEMLAMGDQTGESEQG